LSDNVVANAGSGGSTFATDDIGGVHYPRSKVVWGADGAVNDTSAAAPMPVVQTGTPGLPTGAATEATLAAAAASLSVLDDWDESDRAKVMLPRPATGTVSVVADNAASVTVLASNANRLGAIITNDSSALLFLKAGATASTTSYTVALYQYGSWQVPFGYTGIIDGIWASDPGDGAARVTEFTA
jgi:hypothetical protein